MSLTATYPAPYLVRQARSAAGIYFVAFLMVVASIACWMGGQGSLLRIIVTVGAPLLALAIYCCREEAYVPYALWVWFLAPLARRIVDWRFGFVESNVVLLAPLLVSAISALTIIKAFRRGTRRIQPAFVLCAGAIFYGFAVGMILEPSFEVCFGLLTWMTPLLLGLHVCLSWNDSDMRRLSRTFSYALLVLGLYGVYQFLDPPAWDRFWLENTIVGGLNLSFGRPNPFEVRVWSTLNSPGPFANVIAVGALLLFQEKSWLKIPSAVAGYSSFALSLVRTSWLGWCVGVALMLRRRGHKQFIRAALFGVVLLGCLLLLSIDPRVDRLIGDRVGSLSDLSKDASAQDRFAMYLTFTKNVAQHPFGFGLSNFKTIDGVAIDSGILAVMYQLGWVGFFLFSAGILFLLRGTNSARDRFVCSPVDVSKIVMAVLLLQLIGGNIFVGVNGALFWIFAGASTADREVFLARSRMRNARLHRH